MLRVKFVPLLMPVVIGAAYLWYRSKKKSLTDGEDDSESKNADDDSANGSEDPSLNATPTARRSPLTVKRSSCNNNLDSGTNSSDEAPVCSAVDAGVDEQISAVTTTLIASAIPSSEVDDKKPDSSLPQRHQQDQHEPQDQQFPKRCPSNSSIVSHKSSSSNFSAPNGEKTYSSKNNGWSGTISRRRTRGSMSDSVTSTGSECDNWRENMGKTWEPLPEPRPTPPPPTQQRGAAGKGASGDISTNQHPTDEICDSSGNNGIIITYPEAPSVSSKGRWNNNGSRTPNGATPPPPPPPAQSNHQHVVYEFEFPSELIGRLIGKGGRNLQQMMKETGTQIGVRKQQSRPDHQIVTVQGRHEDVQRMLKSVRTKFPRHHNPNVDIRPINVPMPQRLMMPETLWMTLPEGAPVNAVVVNVLSAGHIFLQLPSHPTFPNLPRLDACMLACYTSSAAPPVDTSLQPGQLCAAPLCGGWFRAQIVQVIDAPLPSTENGGSGDFLPGMLSGQEAYLRWVDYGGYSQVPIKDLRQCRSDFMTLPFQAIECYLGNVSPPHSEDGSVVNPYEFPIEGAFFLEEAVKNSIIEVEVVAYAEDGLPCVHLFKNENGFGGGVADPNARTLINKELVERGFATWVEGIPATELTGEECEGEVFQ